MKLPTKADLDAAEIWVIPTNQQLDEWTRQYHDKTLRRIERPQDYAFAPLMNAIRVVRPILERMAKGPCHCPENYHPDNVLCDNCQVRQLLTGAGEG